MDTNKNIALRKMKRQEAPSNSTNLSNNVYECTEGTRVLNEKAADNLIPVRLWIRGHYTNLIGNNKTRCIHCNALFLIITNFLVTFHKHLVEAHPDKLTEEEKKEVKFHWTWDYYTPKDTKAECKKCKKIIMYKDTAQLRSHLKRIHMISGPTSDNVINNESSSDDHIDANKDTTLRKAKRQEVSSNSTNLFDNLYERIMHECAEEIKAMNEEAQNSLVPVRLWIRRHYTNLTRNSETKCIYCNTLVFVRVNYLVNLHYHLVEAHPDKLTEEEKKEVKFHWTWDYFILKGETKAECKKCTKIIKYNCTNNLKFHLKKIHMIRDPTSDSIINNESSSHDDMDANKDFKKITLRKAKRQEAPSNSNLSDNLYECAEGTEAINEKAGNNLVPVRLWIRGHYTNLTRNNETRCIHCNTLFSVNTNYLFTLHKHLVNAHPDKLTEEKKKEVKFHWTWDYYIPKDTKAECKKCKKIINCGTTNKLRSHLKRIHMILGPSSDNDMDANKDVTVRKAKHQKASCNSTNLSNKCREGLNEGTSYNLIPIRRWIREHYTKLTRNNRARCNNCNRKFIIHMNKLAALYKHLVEIHPDKLTEQEKNEVKFHWAWDYYIIKSNAEARCKLCKVIVKYKHSFHLRIHLGTRHKITGPTSDNVINNESSSHDDMDANKDITIRKAKRQEASSNSNLSDNLYECAEGTEAINEEAQNNLVPVRLWIRGHYTNLTRNNETRCIHCNILFFIDTTYSLVFLHEHLVEAHPDKLTEEEKEEVEFHWTWDYYIVKSNTEARCKPCKMTVRYTSTFHLKMHLRTRHKISGPTSDNVIDNESSSDNDMDANEDVTIRKAKRQEASSNSTNLSDSLYECAEGTEAINEGTSYNLIPIRRWIREHYTKLTRNRARCNHCNERYSIHVQRLNSLHKHLVEAHPDKLAEVEKNEVKFHWIWDYYIVKSNTEARCKLCKITVRYTHASHLKTHLSTRHKISGPTSDNVIDNKSSSDNDMDANENVTIRKAKRQEASSNSTNLSDSLYECAEGTEAINEGTSYNLIPIRRWIREHYTKLTRNRARCNHCNERYSIHIQCLNSLHKHLVEAHPDKLAEVEKNEVKFHWAFDYYIVKSNTEARCKLCKRTVRYKGTSDVRIHLSTHHKISGPTSDNVIDNESSSDNDMDANEDVTIRKAKRQTASRNSTKLSNSLDGCTEGTKGLNEKAQNNFVPVRLWIREHYTKLTRNNKVSCIHCNEKLTICMGNLAALHKHLVETHPDKLAEEQKKEIKFHWIWDYYIAKSGRKTRCKRCKAIVMCYKISNLIKHLRRIHKISDPTSDNIIDNESSSDDDMDITLRKAKHQEVLSNSTNLSNSLNECTEGTNGLNEEAQNNLVPVLLWIRGHYTKLTRNNKARCIHCNRKFIIYMNKLATLHKHLVETHPDKLTEDEKKEVKFYDLDLGLFYSWTWDYFTIKDCTMAICKICKATLMIKNVANFKGHLESIHKLSGPTSDHIIDNENSSDNVMDANQEITLRKPKGQEASFNSTNLSNSLNECTEGINGLNEEAQNNLALHECRISGPTSDHVIDNENSSANVIDVNQDIRKPEGQEVSSNSTKLSDSLNECTEGINGLNEEAQNNLVSVLLWIRGHYTKLMRNNKARCIHCNRKFIIYMNKLAALHKHLVETHPDKLTEDEKKEVKFYDLDLGLFYSWTWDYFTLKDCTMAICKICKATLMIKNVANFKGHLESIHKIPTSDHVMDNENGTDDMGTNKDITLRKAKCQEASSNSNLSDNLYECAEETEAINE